MKKQTLLLGAHISTAGGFDKAVERAASINCTCFQIFTKSNRQWHAKPIQESEINAFQNALKNHPSIQSVVAHASYLINIVSKNKFVREQSLKSLALELERCKQLKIPYLILHPGSSNTTLEKTLDELSEKLIELIKQSQDTPMILLETMAGQGASICYTFEQLAAILDRITPQKIGICVDTCHIFSAGYDLRTKYAYEKVWHEFDTIIGLEHLKVFHINDSKKELGSRIDRHEHIGKGKIGLEGFKLLFNDSRFFNIPKILETPKEHGLQEDAMNMEIIYSLLSENTKKILNINDNFLKK